MSDIGYATLQVIPAAKNFSANLSREISGPLARSGAEAGQKAGGGFARNFGKAAVAGFAVVAAGVSAFAAKSSAKFAEVGGEVTKLSRFTGLAAEDASRLRFAGKEAGVGVDVLTKSLGILSKNLAGKSLDKLGFDFKDANGKIRPLNGSLLQIAKRFQSMPNGAEKTALAMKLFGRSGADLIPFLNRGADGIAELERQSDKFGQTLSGKDLEAVKASTAAHRAFDAALEGLQIQVGRYVLPVFTKFVTFATTSLMPAIGAVSDLARKYLAPAFDFAFGLIDRVMSRAVAFMSNTLVPGVKDGIAKIVAVVTPFAEKAWAAFERIRTAIDDRLTPALRDRLMPILKRVANFVAGNLAPALAGAGAAGALALGSQFAGLAASIGGVIQTLAVLPNPVIIAAAAVAALAAGFVYAYKHSERFRQIVQKVIGGVKQILSVVFKGDFIGAGPFAEDSPVIVGLLRFREIAQAVVRDVLSFWRTLTTGLTSGGRTSGVERLALAIRTNVLPILHQVADFVKAHLKPILIGLGIAAALIVAPVLTVATALVVLYTRSETFRTIVQKVADFLATKVAPRIAAFAGYVSEQFSNLVGYVRKHWAAISEAIGHVIETIKVIITVAVNIISALWRAWGDDLLHFAEAFFGHIRDSIANALTVVRGIIDVVLSLINGDWGKAWDGVKEILSGVWAEIGNIVGLALDTLRAVIGGVLSTIAQVWNGVWMELSGVVSAAWDLVVGIVVTSVAKVIGFITGMPGQIAAIASTMWDSLGDGLGAVIDWIVGRLEGLVNTIIDVINGAIGAYNKIPLAPNIRKIPHVGEPTKAKAGPSHGALGSLGFAEGGFVKHRPGGILANIGEGRHDEVVVPLSAKNLATLAKAMPPGRPAADLRPIYIDIHPSAGMDEEAIGKAAYREFAQRARAEGPFLTKIGAAK